MKLRTGLLAAGLVVVAGAANAQPVNGLYVGGAVGYNLMSDFAANSRTVGGVTTTINGSKFTPNGGLAGLGSVGWGYGNGFRAELELNYRNQNMGGSGFTVSGGKQTTYGAMVNGLYDFDLGAAIYPYLGAGVGYEVSQLRGTVAGTNVLGGSKGNLALQGIAGLSVPVSGAPGLSVTAEYRLLARPQNDNNSYNAGGVGGTLNTASQYNHSFMLGLRYAFGAPTPAPAPVVAAPAAAPAPAPARTYLVFFDWDKSDLTARARQIIAEAAQASTKVATTRVEVAGNADKSGTPAYNLALSQRRADAVAAELVRSGVAKGSIFVTANGQTKPIVPTADGVREPQNRNVEIVLK